MNGDTLKIYDDGTFQYFIDRCELEIVGSWSTSRNSKNRKRMELERCQTSGLCAAVEAFCDNPFWKSLATGTSATNLLCAAIETEVLETIGAGIGFLFYEFGPHVPLQGAFLGQRYGQEICEEGIKTAIDVLCEVCT